MSMSSRRVLTVLGARPQFVKAAVVSRALAADGLVESILHTGQHFDERMSEVFFREMGIAEPRWNLGVSGLTHGAMTARMLEGIEAVLLDARPDLVLVYGDTNSTLAGALAAAKLGIPIGHVEAGLRSFNRAMPEEVNRILTDHAAQMLFAPTATAVENLRSEGFADHAIHRVGDVMYDACLAFGELAAARSTILGELGLADRSYVLATIHRQENTDTLERLAILIEALATTAGALDVVLPLHPRTRAALGRQPALASAVARLRIVEPVGFLDMIMLERHARLIATDSGGVQKEAYFHGVPCVTLRKETEWVELLEIGANRLAPPVDVASVAAAIEAMLRIDPADFTGHAPFGDGRAAVRIAQVLGDYPCAASPP